MTQLQIAAGVVALATIVSVLLRRHQRPDAPTQATSYLLPAQLDRADFARPEAPWLVAVFSSATCTTCADIVRKCNVLASSEVSVQNVAYGAAPALHRKYDIQAVPMVAIADRAGVVQAGFIGPVSATDLWAAIAEVREPGSSPEPDLGR